MVIMVFDNSYSCLRPKTLAYKVSQSLLELLLLPSVCVQS